MTKAEDFFQKGMEMYLIRNFEESVEWFTKALAENPENVNYYYYRGMALQEINQYAAAIVDYSAALDRYLGCIPIRYNRADLYQKIGQEKRAVEDLTYIILHADQTKGEGYWLALAYLNRGLASIDCGNLEQGLDDLGKAEFMAKKMKDKTLLTQISEVLENSGL
ncbi:MAG TPA: tetratricopeptide repeat protein [Methanocorpusculum sp.]|nr:tetratricopeptide repeat protein [Methanocorpusculum sp.]HJJ90449.1 tetratricopeptide repeat protein [Methanocorpusculum sp.]HJK01554.1 tetratricopeptide repeat protein [Methanocorpusculum sp.]HJK02578.1 tetratricopeptide repeat protein [Methanocorpusculum sp.]